MASFKNKKSVAVVLFALTLLIVAPGATRAQGRRRSGDNARKQVLLNAKKVMALQARGPQPRAVCVVSQHRWELVEPWQTVLHRCDDVACCAFHPTPHNKICVHTVESVQLFFNLRNFVNHRLRKIEYQFQNHTRCECQTLTEPRFDGQDESQGECQDLVTGSRVPLPTPVPLPRQIAKAKRDKLRARWRRRTIAARSPPGQRGVCARPGQARSLLFCCVLAAIIVRR